jgi:hypothetical protein
MVRLRDEETERWRDGETERQRDGETKRRRDGETKRWRDTFFTLLPGGAAGGFLRKRQIAKVKIQC